MSVAALPVAPVFASPSSEGREYDDPREWAAFSRPVEGSAKLWESQLVVQGMHCAACSLNVEQALGGVGGIVSAEVNAASERARLVWDPAQVQPSGWMQAVRQAGYRLLPAADAFTHEQRRRQQRLMLWRWLVAGFCMMQVMMYAMPAYVAGPGEMTPDVELLLRWASWVLSLPVVFFSCGPFFSVAWRDLAARRISMDLPVALGIASVLVVSVIQRSKDIGILRAMGTSRGQILRIFLLQGGLLGCLGSVVGAAAGGADGGEGDAAEAVLAGARGRVPDDAGPRYKGREQRVQREGE